MKGIFLLVVSAVLATIASLLYIQNFATYPILFAFGIAVIMWSPCNAVFTKALNSMQNIAMALVVFSIATTMTDTLGGIIFQKPVITNVFFLILGLALGFVIVFQGAKTKAESSMPKKSFEIGLYVIGGLSLVLAYILKDYWYVQVFAYAITDLVGGVLTLRLLGFFSEQSQGKFWVQYLVGVLAFIPITFTFVLMVQTMQNIVIAGPSATIVSCAVAMLGGKLLLGKLPKLSELFYLLLAVACVVLIFLAFA